MPVTKVGSRWINGNLVFHSSTNRKVLYHAIGPTAYKWEERGTKLSTDGATTIDGYTVTVVSVGANDSLAALDGAGGGFVITAANQDNDGFNIQAVGEHFLLASGKPCYFGIKMKLNDATQTDFIAGLCITDTDLLGGLTDGVYFRKVDASTSVSLVIEHGSTETTGVVKTLADDTYVTLEWYFDGTNVDSFVDGVLQTRLAVTNLPHDAELTPSIHFLTGEAVANVMTVAWARAIQLN